MKERSEQYPKPERLTRSATELTVVKELLLETRASRMVTIDHNYLNVTNPDLLTAFNAEKNFPRLHTLGYALGEKYGVTGQYWDEFSQKFITHMLERQMEEDETLFFGKPHAGTRPVQEIVNTRNVLQNIVEKPAYEKKMVAFYMTGANQIGINIDDENLVNLRRLEIFSAQLEAIDYIFGEDNIIADIVKSH